MDRNESSYYIIMLALVLFVLPGSKNSFGNLFWIIAVLLLFLSFILVSLKNISYIPSDRLKDDQIHLVVWISILFAGIVGIFNILVNSSI